MVAEFGCRYAIVGHSERRHDVRRDRRGGGGEVAAARRAGLTPIFCVGETLAEREAGVTEAVLARQVDAVLERAARRSWTAAIVAYEPVWAIGTGRTATSEQAQEVHAFIRGARRREGRAVARRLPILYGGSVKARERRGVVRDAGRRRRAGRRGVAGGGRIRGDLARSRRARRR